MIKVVILVFLALSISLGAQALLKKGLTALGAIDLKEVSDLPSLFLRLIQNKLVILGFILTVAGFSLWLMALSSADLSFIIPIANGFVYVILFLLSWFVLKEDISIWRIIGTAIILCGAWVILILGK